MASIAWLSDRVDARGVATIVALRQLPPVVIIVNHIHTCALCASLQSAAVQARYTRARFVHTRPDVSVWPMNEESSSVMQFFFCNTCVGPCLQRYDSRKCLDIN